MLADSFTYSVDNVSHTFLRVATDPGSNAAGQFLQTAGSYASTRAEPITLQISFTRQGTGKKQVLRTVRSWRIVRINSLGEQEIATYATSLYLPIYASETDILDTNLPKKLNQLDTGFTWNDTWSSLTGPQNASRFDDVMRGGA